MVKGKRNFKTIIENKEVKFKIRSLNIDLSYSEVGELIDILPRWGDLRDLKKDLMAWYGKIK